MEGVQLSAADIGDIQPLVTVRDFQDLLARLDAFPNVVENNLALLDAGRRLGFGPPKITLVGIPGQITSQITPDPMSSPVLKPFREFPGTVTAAERPRLTSQAVQVYRDRVCTRALEVARVPSHGLPSHGPGDHRRERTPERAGALLLPRSLADHDGPHPAASARDRARGGPTDPCRDGPIDP